MFKSKNLIVLITLIPFFTSCVDENIINEKVTEQQVADNVTFVTDNNSSVQRTAALDIIARLGRNSRNCRGFGICSVRPNRIDMNNPNEGNNLLLKFVSENTLFAELKDFPTLDIDLKDYPLNLDEDILFISNKRYHGCFHMLWFFKKNCFENGIFVNAKYNFTYSQSRFQI